MGLPRASPKTCRNKLDFQGPLDSENEAPAWARAQFSLFEGCQKMSPKRLPKWSQNGTKIRPKAFRRRSGSVPENDAKIDTEIDAKSEPHWAQKGAKIDPKRCLKTESITRGVQGSPQEPLGSILGAIFEYCMCFLYFPSCLF